MIDKGDDENFKGLKSSQKSFSICVCQVYVYVNVVGLHFMKEYLNYWELQRTTIICKIYKVDHEKGSCSSL